MVGRESHSGSNGVVYLLFPSHHDPLKSSQTISFDRAVEDTR